MSLLGGHIREKWIPSMLMIIILYANPTMAQIINTNLSVGPNHDGNNVIEICFSMTNTFPNDFDIMSLDEQVIVIQWTQGTLSGDLSEPPLCFDPRDFTFSPATIDGRINQNMLVTNRSDLKDFEISWRFRENFALGPGQTIELACILNTNISGMCDNLVAFVDCSGTQFTKFANGNVIPTSEEACPVLMLPGCDESGEELPLEVFCKNESSDQITIGWEEQDIPLDYEVRINGQNWQNSNSSLEYTIDNLFEGESVFVQVRGLNNCGPDYANSLTCQTQANQAEGSIVFIPNIFSPNGDGNNDRFMVIPANGYQVRSYDIYNRYGSRIHRFQNDGSLQVAFWDGKSDGKVLDGGVVVCKVTLVDQEGMLYYRVGDVTIVK